MTISSENLRKQISIHFYSGATESVLTRNMINGHGMCIAQKRKALQQVIKTSQNITANGGPIISESVE